MGDWWIDESPPVGPTTHEVNLAAIAERIAVNLRAVGMPFAKAVAELASVMDEANRKARQQRTDYLIAALVKKGWAPKTAKAMVDANQVLLGVRPSNTSGPGTHSTTVSFDLAGHAPPTFWLDEWQNTPIPQPKDYKPKKKNPFPQKQPRHTGPRSDRQFDHRGRQKY